MDRRKSTITLTVLGLLCVFGLLFGLRAVTASLPGDGILKDPKPTCTERQVARGATITAEDVVVSVYNAGGRSGLASKTMQGLVERGFVAGSTGNARNAEVKRAQIWADSKENPAAKLIARQIGGGVKIHADKQPLGVGVTVVLGKDFSKLKTSAPSKIKAAKATTICGATL